MLLAVDLYEHFVDEEGVAVALVISLQLPRIFSSELDAPETDRFVGDGYATLS